MATFSCEPSWWSAGTITVAITDIFNNVFTATSGPIAKDDDTASFGGWSIDGDIIKSIFGHDDRHRRLQGTEADSRNAIPATSQPTGASQLDTLRNESMIKLALDTVDLVIFCGPPLACGIVL
jgi:hypothetical protein